jgi:hypothetical protein
MEEDHRLWTMDHSLNNEKQAGDIELKRKNWRGSRKKIIKIVNFFRTVKILAGLYRDALRGVSYAGRIVWQHLLQNVSH